LPDTFEEILGHSFSRPELLREAMTHRSVINIQPSKGRKAAKSLPRAVSNERLEFLGDRVLGLLIAEWLAERFPDEQEGDLGRRLAHLVSMPVLAEVAGEIGLADALNVAPGETRAGVKGLANVLADALEAALGAMFLDGGLDPARAFVRRSFVRILEEQLAPPESAKSALQEWALARGHKSPEYPVYNVVSRTGPPHDPVFVVQVSVGARKGRGIAGSKRAAEQMAANDLLGQLENK
jgi:ribonuclease-3